MRPHCRPTPPVTGSGISTIPRHHTRLLLDALQTLLRLAARRPPHPHNLILALSSTSAVAVIHTALPGIPIPLFPLPTSPEHDPGLLWISVFTKLKLKINFNYQNQIAVSINHWGPLGDTDRRLHLELEGGRDNDSFPHQAPPCSRWTIFINIVIFCIIEGIKGRRMELESVLNK